MRPLLVPLSLAVMLAIAATCSPAPRAAPPASGLPQPPREVADKVKIEIFVRAEKPVGLTAPPGDPRIFIVEKTGRLRVVKNGKLEKAPFLDLSDRVSRGTEQGLLGLAFHPKYAENGRFYVNYTDREGDTRIVEYRVSASDRDRADPQSARELLVVDQPYSNHNGGHLAFGPDGKLYIGLGDGGAANDPHGAGQDPKTLLGKMVRLDVDAAQPKPEIWASGLRNPWRYAFDRKTNDLYIADVGQHKWEEVDVVAWTARGGHNFGWNVMEGAHCFRDRRCDASKYVAPVVEYGREGGCSITGGHVYRGRALPELDGVYFYADYCSGLLRSFRWANGQVADHWDWKPVLDPRNKLATVSAFGEDAAGELYLLSLDGDVHRLSRK